MCATYSPTSPMAMRVAPEKMMLRQTIDVQPGTVSFKTFAAKTLYAAYAKPQAATKNPKTTLRRKGSAENDVIAVQANRHILRGEYFVRPATRALRWYGRMTSRSPSHATIPLMNRC